MNSSTPTNIGIVRDTLHQRIAAHLHELLTQGTLKPGSKLNERELCEMLHVSRTPLREAIRLLAAEGMVVLKPGRGAFALNLSDSDIAYSFDVLASLEGLAGQLAAPRITEEELSELSALQHEMEAAFERRDLPTYYNLNAQVHALINEAAGNPVLRDTWNQINSRMHTLRFRSNQDEVKWAHALKEHAQILAALKKRDGATVRQLLESHLLRKRDKVLENRTVTQNTRNPNA